MDRWPAYRSTAHVLFLEYWSSLQNERLAVIQHLGVSITIRDPFGQGITGVLRPPSNRCRREGLRALFRRPRLAAIGEYHRSFRQSGREHVGLTGQGGKYNPGWYQTLKSQGHDRKPKNEAFCQPNRSCRHSFVCGGISLNTCTVSNDSTGCLVDHITVALWLKAERTTARLLENWPTPIWWVRTIRTCPRVGHVLDRQARLRAAM